MTTSRMTLFFLLALLASFTTAQVGTILDPSKLPKCAYSCQTLLSAQQLCVPPVAPTQNQAIYQTCFCNSNYLVNYKAGAVSPTCDDACTTDSDRKEIQQWFVKLCSSGAVVTPEGNQVNPQATQTGTGAAGSATGGTSSGSSSGSGTPGPKSWISTHYQWVILVIVLIIAAAVAIYFGLRYKRRHDRKWATGGYARESMLQAQDIANSLSNRHPETGMPNMRQVPDSESNAYLNGSREQLSMSGANPKAPASARATEVRR